jgi:hypothetical protein
MVDVNPPFGGFFDAPLGDLEANKIDLPRSLGSAGAQSTSAGKVENTDTAETYALLLAESRCSPSV